MKAKLKVKFKQYLDQKKQDEGFTLIELLVVIIIIGILAAIALPSFLSQTAKARGAEAKNIVGSMNNAQQAHYLEHQSFTTTVPDLSLSMINSTDNFTYSAEAGIGGLTSAIINLGTSLRNDIKSYSGGAFYQTGAVRTILCEAINPDDTEAAHPTSSTTCAATTLPIK